MKNGCTALWRSWRFNPLKKNGRGRSRWLSRGRVMFNIFWVLGFCVGAILFIWAAWHFRQRHLHRSLRECFAELVIQMPFDEARLQKYPVPAMAGKYFGFQFAL